jgi:hypothetical protein
MANLTVAQRNAALLQARAEGEFKLPEEFTILCGLTPLYDRVGYTSTHLETASLPKGTSYLTVAIPRSKPEANSLTVTAQVEGGYYTLGWCRKAPDDLETEVLASGGANKKDTSGLRFTRYAVVDLSSDKGAYAALVAW